MLTHFLSHSIAFHFPVPAVHVLFLEHPGLCDMCSLSCQFHFNSIIPFKAHQEDVMSVAPIKKKKKKKRKRRKEEEEKKKKIQNLTRIKCIKETRRRDAQAM